MHVEVEILDLDAAATMTEVLEALCAAITGWDDPAIKPQREAISDVRIWLICTGQQIATVKITVVLFGWTMCRVRPKTLPPERCFRCQAFDHNSRGCTEIDRSG